jgi:hypothetical protein
MKKLLVTFGLTVVELNQKQTNSLDSLCYMAALFNSGLYEKKTADKFLKEIFNSNGLYLTKDDDTTYRFGFKKKNLYIECGEINIIKTPY